MPFPHCRSRAGITLVEAVIAMLLVAVMAAAGLNAAGQASTHRARMEQRAFADEIAQGLLAEIRSKRYTEGDVIGPDAGETSRDQFDDVDDYEGYGAKPITNAAGDALTDASWKVGVEVAWITPGTGDRAASDQGAKLIRVTVLVNGKAVAVREGIASRLWSEAQ